MHSQHFARKFRIRPGRFLNAAIIALVGLGIASGTALADAPYGRTPVIGPNLIHPGLVAAALPQSARPPLRKLELDTGIIAFSHGVPVGGYSHVSLFPNGAFSFTGHFHVSGAPSYNTSMVWAIKTCSGTVITFSHVGRVHGTFESGSRDDNWGNSGINPALAQAWGDLSNCYRGQWKAAVNADIGALLDSAVKAVGQAAKIIALVA